MRQPPSPISVIVLVNATPLDKTGFFFFGGGGKQALSPSKIVLEEFQTETEVAKVLRASGHDGGGDSESWL
jgi:hypothetical protein